MKEFEVIYAETVEAEDFFDAIDKIQRKDGREVLSCSEAPKEEEDVFN